MISSSALSRSARLFIKAFICLLIHMTLTEQVQAQEQDTVQNTAQTKQKVFVLKIRQEIDPRSERYLNLALDEAKERKADMVLIDMDTYGGAVDNADNMRTRILNFEIPIHVYINDNAVSAGALISIACDSIYMAPGANIGAATVVFGDGQPAPDKYQSFMRSKMRATAEEQGRDPEIAEGMVGRPMEDGSIGGVISYTTDEAIRNNYCEGKARSIDEVLTQHLGLENYERIDYELPGIESVISFFLNPFLRSILLLVILGGIYFELQTPGVGFPILAALIAAVLYFIPSYLHGLAGYWEFLLIAAGVILLLLEILVIPGFGVPGILGIIAMSTGFILVMVNNEGFDFTFVPMHEIVEAIFVFFIGLAGALILMFAGGGKFMQTKAFKRVMLADIMDSKEGWTSHASGTALLGKTGTAYTVLRPSGKIMIDGVIYDGSSRGEYIEKGAIIEVIEVVGSTVKVKKQA